MEARDISFNYLKQKTRQSLGQSFSIIFSSFPTFYTLIQRDKDPYIYLSLTILGGVMFLQSTVVVILIMIMLKEGNKTKAIRGRRRSDRQGGKPESTKDIRNAASYIDNEELDQTAPKRVQDRKLVRSENEDDNEETEVKGIDATEKKDDTTSIDTIDTISKTTDRKALLKLSIPAFTKITKILGNSRAADLKDHFEIHGGFEVTQNEMKTIEKHLGKETANYLRDKCFIVDKLARTDNEEIDMILNVLDPDDIGTKKLQLIASLLNYITTLMTGSVVFQAINQNNNNQVMQIPTFSNRTA